MQILDDEKVRFNNAVTLIFRIRFYYQEINSVMKGNFGKIMITGSKHLFLPNVDGFCC
jgi:hypothetical protein